MKRICVINVVGLTPKLLSQAPHIRELAESRDYNVTPWRSPLPAVTATCQATMLTGKSPAEHGIVGNGWYFRDTQEVRFWQQANSLIQARPFYDDYETAKLFWWFNQSSSARYSVTPKPHYGCDGSKVFDILDYSDCRLTERLGAFPFFSFWGPGAGLDCSKWIAAASEIVLQEKRPQVTLVYLPHLDYDFQRLSNPPASCVAEVDQCAYRIIRAAESIDAIPIVVSEYGLVPVDQPIDINRELRKADLLKVRSGPFGEMLMPGESLAFAVADHQLAHVYVNQSRLLDQVRELLNKIPGIDRVVEPDKLGLSHPRSGELIALAKPNAWFTYYYWLEDRSAPDYARTVDIHRKPGYDPCELFMTSKLRAMRRLLQKKLGFRYRMDVVPLEANRVQGSHGVHPPDANDGPLIVGPKSTPTDMRDFAAYAKNLLEQSTG